jgi:hypothetical protein
MSKIIDFPSGRVKPYSLPQPGDRYQAYGLWDEVQPPAMMFVFPDWGLNWLNYAELGHGDFRILNDEGDRDGHSAFTLNFGRARDRHEAVITGYNIFDLCFRLFHHDVKWI